MKEITRFIFVMSFIFCGGASMADDTQSLPVAAPIDTDSAGRGGDVAVQSVMRILCLSNNSQGTGFLHKSGKLLTADHVVSGCSDVRIIKSDGSAVTANILASDKDIDLAILEASAPINGKALEISSKSEFTIGTQVSTWGFPAGYSGAAPMLSVGYLSGLNGLRLPSAKIIKQWVVNAAFNGGNSGGPLIHIETGHVIGVVSSKLAPISQQALSVLQVLESQKFGMQYQATSATGAPMNVSEAQLVGLVLQELRRQVQLVIGMAVYLDDIKSFLKSNNIDP